MRNTSLVLSMAGLFLVTSVALGQEESKLTFEVASVKPAAPIDFAKLVAAAQNGEAPGIGMKIDRARAQYTYMALKDLIGIAYKVKPYQIIGPAWMAEQRFDIVAKFPDGASKDDAPEMLRALLKERFKLEAHIESKERPVMALVLGKGGLKITPSSTPAEDFDENAPLKPGEMKMDTPDGPIRVTSGKDGGGTMNMGKKGSVTFRMDGNRSNPSTLSMHLEFSHATMEGFADLLTQLSPMGGGGTIQIKDMTQLKGNYEIALNIPLGDLMAQAQAAAASGATAGVASDPGGGISLSSAVAALGLKLEPGKAMVEQLIVDHAEKVPTEN
jgi:uncharacterized protein (TIGR03435 family)